MSRFYRTDPDDPTAPVELREHTGRWHGVIRPGDLVAYENPATRREDGTYRAHGMDGPLAVTEIIDFGDDPDEPGHRFVQAVLNDGEYECNADNLRALR